MTHASAALMFHVMGWDATGDSRVIAPGLRVARLSDSRVEALYHHLCEHDGVDDGEPFSYLSFAEFTPSERMTHFLDAGDPYSVVDGFCNVVALCTARPVSMTRIIWSHDDFLTAQSTERVHVTGAQSEFLQPDFPDFTDALLDRISLVWRHLHPSPTDSSPRRLHNALTYYGYAWRAWYLDQVCLNLSIVIEIPFAPHTQSETTHQLAFNVAHFIGGTRAERERHFDLVRDFYRLRSSIVHGGSADEDKLVDIVPRMFDLVAQVLAGILASESLTQTFASESSRRQLLRDLTFWEAKHAAFELAP